MSAETKTLRTLVKHKNLLQIALFTIIDDLTKRSRNHDLSKFNDDEFEGFSNFAKLDPSLEYGSDEYRMAYREIKPEVDSASALHYKRNSHHPEYHEKIKKMPLLDLIEMVCDWYAASKTYSNDGDFNVSVDICKKRYAFTREQLWLIDQVADILIKIDSDQV